jgi:16S rRNA (adenine1518-N6/adenine1519-N6)-dimethyltransferase
MLPDKKVKEILKDRKLAPKKRYGQNFLVNKNISENIVNLTGVDSDDTVIEVGVGLGALTNPLAKQCKKVIGLEIDAGIVRFHQEEGDLPDNVILQHQDILQADLKELSEQTGHSLKVIANLPYSISNPLLFKLIDHQDLMEWAVLMLQKEVAQRLSADVGTKDYGILTVRMAGCAAVEKLMELGPQHFHPRPKVDSQVVKITFHPKPDRVRALPEHDPQLLETIVRAAFQQRRKILINALSAANLTGIDKKTIGKALERAGLPAQIRGERLSVEEYVILTNLLSKKGLQNL